MWLERRFGARVTWLPFDLHPEYPPEGIPRAQLIARYGEGYDRRTREMFAAEGLVYSPPPDVVSNTRLALELGEQARAEGLHRAYHDRVMEAYWAESADISRRAVLEELAQSAGVSQEGISLALDERPWGAAVDASTARAQRAGATGVPAFVIDWRVPGRRGPAARAPRAGGRPGPRHGDLGRFLATQVVGGAVEPPPELLGRQRPAQPVALDRVAPEQRELVVARLALDAFGDDLEAEVVAERDDRAHDGCVVARRVHVAARTSGRS